MPARREAAVLECLLCRRGYTLSDAKRGLYFVDTLVCHQCYEEMAEQPVKETCFGKKQTKKHVGFSPRNVECKLLCPDRTVCPQFISIKEKRK